MVPGIVYKQSRKTVTVLPTFPESETNRCLMEDFQFSICSSPNLCQTAVLDFVLLNFWMWM